MKKKKEKKEIQPQAFSQLIVLLNLLNDYQKDPKIEESY